MGGCFGLYLPKGNVSGPITEQGYLIPKVKRKPHIILYHTNAQPQYPHWWKKRPFFADPPHSRGTVILSDQQKHCPKKILWGIIEGYWQWAGNILFGSFTKFFLGLWISFSPSNIDSLCRSFWPMDNEHDPLDCEEWSNSYGNRELPFEKNRKTTRPRKRVGTTTFQIDKGKDIPKTERPPPSRPCHDWRMFVNGPMYSRLKAPTNRKTITAIFNLGPRIGRGLPRTCFGNGIEALTTKSHGPSLRALFFFFLRLQTHLISTNLVTSTNNVSTRVSMEKQGCVFRSIFSSIHFFCIVKTLFRRSTSEAILKKSSSSLSPTFPLLYSWNNLSMRKGFLKVSEYWPRLLLVARSPVVHLDVFWPENSELWSQTKHEKVRYHIIILTW